jgi:hypothetical protein
MEHSVKEKFLAQKRLKPNCLDSDLRRPKSSDLFRLISAVASVAFMGILMHAIAVMYLSKPAANAKSRRRGNFGS